MDPLIVCSGQIWSS